MNFISDLYNKYKPLLVQFFKFGVVGLINTGVSYGIYALTVFIFEKYIPEPHIVKPHILGTILGFVISVLNAYFLSKRFVFRKGSENNSKKRLVKTYIAYGFTFLLSLLFIYVIVDIWGINKYVAPFLYMPITIPTNFFMNKFFVFKEKRSLEISRNNPEFPENLQISEDFKSSDNQKHTNSADTEK